MLTYFKGTSTSLLIACIGYYLSLQSKGLNFGSDKLFIITLLVIALCVYAFGIFGYFLIKILDKRNIKSIWIRLILFALLGEVAALLLYVIVPFYWIFHIITVTGSIVYYLSSLVKNPTLSYLLIALGPLVTIIALCFF